MLDKVKSRLMQRYGPKHSSGTFERKVAPPAVETTEVHTFREEVQPVVLREDNEVEVRTTIQPVLEDQQKDAEVIEDVEPLRYVEVQQEPEDEDRAIEEANRDALEALGRHEVEELQPQIVDMGEITETQSRRHVVEIVQPVIRRRVTKDHLTVRYQPRFERFTRVTIRPAHTAHAVSAGQWRENMKGGDE